MSKGLTVYAADRERLELMKLAELLAIKVSGCRCVGAACGAATVVGLLNWKR